MTNPGRELLDSAREDPLSATPTAILKAVRNVPPKDVPHVLSSIGIALAENADLGTELVEILAPELTAQNEHTRLAATRTLSTISAATPEAVLPELAAILEQLEDEFPPVRAAALRCLVSLAESHRDAIVPHLDRIRPLLSDPVPYVGEVALGLFKQLLDEQTTAVIPFIDPIVENLRSPPEFDPRTRLRWHHQHPNYQDRVDRDGGTSADREHYLAVAAYILAQISSEHPDQLSEHVSTLAAVLEREQSHSLQYHLLESIQAVAESTPAAAAQGMVAVGALFAETRDDDLREKAAWTLTWLAEGDVDGIGPILIEHGQTIRSMLNADDAELRAAGVAILSQLAERDAELVAPALPEIRNLVRSDDPEIRGLAIWTLAYAGERDDVQLLKSRANSDSDKQVQAAADQATHVLVDRL